VLPPQGVNEDERLSKLFGPDQKTRAIDLPFSIMLAHVHPPWGREGLLSVVASETRLCDSVRLGGCAKVKQMYARTIYSSIPKMLCNSEKLAPCIRHMKTGTKTASVGHLCGLYSSV